MQLPLQLSYNGESANLLLDSGSEISILRLCEVNDDALVNTNQKNLLKGVNENLVTTLGVAIGKIQVNGITFTHPFHIVADDFPVPAHGILGHDFLSAYHAIINLRCAKLSLSVNGKEICLPITNYSNVLNKTFIIPARCEYVVSVPVNFNDSKICLQKEILPGLYVGNCIVEPKNGFCKISLINSSETPLELNTRI